MLPVTTRTSELACWPLRRLLECLHGACLTCPGNCWPTGDAWRHRLAGLVRLELARDPAASDRANEADYMASIMREIDARDYLFEDDRLVLSLSKVASERGMKGYEVVIPYSALKGIWRADGPLGSLQR